MEFRREDWLSSPSTAIALDRAYTLFRIPDRGRGLRSVPAAHTMQARCRAAFHEPVLLDEIAARFSLPDHSRLLDCTVGDGGHTIRFLQATGARGRVLALDRDRNALRRTRQRLQALQLAAQVTLVHAAFGQVQQIAHAHSFAPVDNILLDLGYSSCQIDTADRGFSLQRDGPLDMRMDQSQPFTAGDIVNTWPEADLSSLLATLGEERHARRVAQAIAQSRPLATTTQLAAVVQRAIPRHGHARIHPATRTFQALRLAVNDELAQLRQVLPQTLDLLAPGGRLFVISFQSLEDRLVKHFLRDHSQRTAVNKYGTASRQTMPRPPLDLLSRRVIKPTVTEIAANPRSRSARLRVAAKAGGQPRSPA